MKADKPTLIAYTVKDGQGAEPKAIWTRIGAAWPHSKGRLFDSPGSVAGGWPYCPGRASDRGQVRRAGVKRNVK
jgi:hypothetical protein